MPRKIEKESKAVIVYKMIRDLISNGEWNAGDRYSSFDISRKFGVGRTTVNDAIKILEKKGFVYILPNVGFVVKRFSSGSREEYIEVRLALMKILARHLIQNQDEKILEEAFRKLRLTKASYDIQEYETVVYGLEDFHLHLFRASGNGYLNSLLEDSEDLYYYLLSRLRRADSQMLGQVVDHEMVFMSALMDSSLVQCKKVLNVIHNLLNQAAEQKQKGDETDDR